MRWRHPQRGLIAPDDFIRIAEDTGAIHYIGDWVLSAVVEQIAAWRKSGTSLRVSVNVSPKQFESGTLHRHIENLLSKFEVPPAPLEIEITENVMVGDPTSAFAQLTAIRSLGVRVALDDFGTGYSSMALLSELPFDVMKIDRSFVARLEHDQRVRAIVRAIASIAQSSHLLLVAEGVETAAQAAELTALGCHELQGFLFGKPMAGEIFARSQLPRLSA